VIHAQTDRFYCFGCGAKGDVLELVMRVESVRSLSQAAEILDARRPLVSVLSSGERQLTPPATARIVALVDRPDLNRTPRDRVMSANAEAWRFLSLPRLADRGRDYLRGRGIDVQALEAEVGRPLVGHTPYSDTGLIEHLTRRGFSRDEIVDSGWGSRRQSSMRDRFRRRLIVPVRDVQDQIIGVYGRDVTDRANQKYLNTAETLAFHKSAALYRPNPSAALDTQGTVVACEGSIDALAIACLAATAGRTAHFAAMSPSGTALTPDHARAILSISTMPPLVCADGDPAGTAASTRWIRTFMAQGRETVVTVLPDGHDPASWLRQQGVAGLSAFIRKGCLERPASEVRPVLAAALLARQSMAEAVTKPGRDPFVELPEVINDLVVVAKLVPSPEAVDRFAHAAAESLAAFDVGTPAALGRMLLAGIRRSQAVELIPAAGAVNRAVQEPRL
jgi:DNA primase